MNILLIGSGGREHALAWSLSASPLCDRLFVAPGNPGTARHGDNVVLDVADHRAVIDFCRTMAIDFVVVGPEGPLVAGLVDDLKAAGIKAFGPGKAAAQLEGSKAFTKDLCAEFNIPTAAYRRFTDADAAKSYIRSYGVPIVVKADGLAAGKGVVVATSFEEAEEAVDMMLGGGFGTAGAEVVIEAFLDGEEASFFALCDGTTALPFGTAQDHKRVGDGDEGPNTGGMGAYSPAAVLTPDLQARVMREIIEPTLAGMRARGTPYTGILYAGLMLTAGGSAAHRIQRPLRRPRDPGAAAAPEIRPRHRAPCRLRRRARQRLAAMVGSRRAHRRDGGERLSGRVRERLGDPRDRRGRSARRRARLPCRNEAGRRSDPRQWRSRSERHGDRAGRSRRRSGAPTRRCRRSTGPAASAAAISAGAP